MAVELDVGQPILLPAGGGEVIGDSEDRRVELLSDRDELHATWSRFGPGRDGADPHVHRRHIDLFYVLAGELTIGLGADRIETVVPAGSLVIAPPLVVHAFRNGNEKPADGGRPVKDATITRGELLADLDEIRIAELRGESSDEVASRTHNRLVSFYVLAGELVVTAGEQELLATAGTWMQIPPGEPHSFAFTGSTHLLEIQT